MCSVPELQEHYLALASRPHPASYTIYDRVNPQPNTEGLDRSSSLLGLL
jgi:hypothetical protein